MIAKRYYELLNLEKNPFSLVPDPDMFYVIDSQMEAINTLIFALENDAPMMRLYGEPGTGKTVLLRYVIEKLKHDYTPSYVTITPITDVGEFLKGIFNLNEKPKEKIKNILDRCIENTIKRGIKRVVVVDEAQDMPHELFLISKYIIDNTPRERGGGKIFFIFAGTEEMEERFKKRDMKPIAQRCPFCSILKGMRKDEVKGYIEFRLRKCDYKGTFPFTDRAIGLIWKVSRGNPRKVNILSERSLLASLVKKKDVVGRSEVKEALKDLPKDLIK